MDKKLINIWNKYLSLFRVDANTPADLKEAFDISEPFNNEIPWPVGECSDFHPTVENFFHACEKLSLGILDLITLGLRLEVRANVSRNVYQFPFQRLSTHACIPHHSPFSTIKNSFPSTHNPSPWLSCILNLFDRIEHYCGRHTASLVV